MSGITLAAGLPIVGVAAQTGAANLRVPVVSVAAQQTLPFTGVAVGAYVLLAFALIVVGFILRFLGREEKV
jgi:hypothetical protein